MSWKDNALMFWSDDNGATWNKITDHNRDPLAIGFERFENKNRMADATLRRYVIAKKRTFSASWTLIPARATGGLTTVDGGWGGEEIEDFHNSVDGAFLMQLRGGDGEIETATVMISDFSKDIDKRGVNDLWTLSLTLEEV